MTKARRRRGSVVANGMGKLARAARGLIQRFATCLPSPRARALYILCCKDVSELTARGHLKGTGQSRSQIRSFVGRAIKIRTRRRRERFLSRGGDVAAPANAPRLSKEVDASKKGVDWPKRCSICIAIVLHCGLGGPRAGYCRRINPRVK